MNIRNGELYLKDLLDNSIYRVVDCDLTAKTNIGSMKCTGEYCRFSFIAQSKAGETYAFEQEDFGKTWAFYHEKFGVMHKFNPTNNK